MTCSYSDIVGRLNKVQLLRRCCLHNAMGDLELHFGQLPILEYVKEHDGCTQAEISDSLAVTPASVALSTKRLQRSGFLEKVVDESNLRRNRISLTSRGREASEKCRRTFDEFDLKMFDGFSEADLETLRGLLDRMTMNITGEETNDVNMHIINTLMEQVKTQHVRRIRQIKEDNSC